MLIICSSPSHYIFPPQVKNINYIEIKLVEVIL